MIDDILRGALKGGNKAMTAEVTEVVAKQQARQQAVIALTALILHNLNRWQMELLLLAVLNLGQNLQVQIPRKVF